MILVDFLQSYNKRVQKQKEKQSFSFLVMPSAVITYPKLQQTSAETKRKTKFFIFGYAECRRNLSKVTTNECSRNFAKVTINYAVIVNKLPSIMQINNKTCTTPISQSHLLVETAPRKQLPFSRVQVDRHAR